MLQDILIVHRLQHLCCMMKFFASIIKDWYNDYQKYTKFNSIKIDFDMIKTVTKYKLLGVLELIKLQGGELEAITNLNEAFKKVK